MKHEIEGVDVNGNYSTHGNGEHTTNGAGSPLYGPNFVPQLANKKNADVSMLKEPEVQAALGQAKEIYMKELKQLGYSPLTINSYSSAIERFEQFLEVGQVIPDYSNKPDRS